MGMRGNSEPALGPYASALVLGHLSWHFGVVLIPTTRQVYRLGSCVTSYPKVRRHVICCGIEGRVSGMMHRDHRIREEA